MSVTVKFEGRTGNRLFQYVIARLVASHSFLELGTEWEENNFIDVTKPSPGVISGKQQTIVNGISPGPRLDLGIGRYHLEGYFQDAELYNQHREEIKGFFRLPEFIKNTEDLVVHLRLADYWCDRVKSVINPLAIIKAIKSIPHRQLFIVVQDHPTNKKYLRAFESYCPQFISDSPKEDFHFIRSFDKIICANSSFSWWAAFLSEARKIVTFDPWYANPGPKLSNMIGTTVMKGGFIRDKQLEALNWDDYWKKDPRTYCCVRSK
jgi:hypothetical protein